MIQQISDFLLWSALINIGILTFWFLMFIYAYDWVYNLHSKWFKLSVESFDRSHYVGMMLYKLAIYFFNFIPWVALKIAF